MKKLSILFSLLSICVTLELVASDHLQIINHAEIRTDVLYDGVKGLTVTYTYNFTSLEALNPNDTVLNNASFAVYLVLFENGNPVKPAFGFQNIENINGQAEFISAFSLTETDATTADKKKTIFIPYAALQQNEGRHTLSIKIKLSGTDGAGITHQQEYLTDSISFDKPKTNTFTMNIDYIEVKPLNVSGQAWDYGFFKTDAPDVGVNILVGTTSVWKSNVNDTYMFSVGPNSRNISFTISENDKVAVLVQDIDILFHDFIARWNFVTSDKKKNILYTYNKAKGNIKSCNLSFKIE